jgi:serine protease Do
MPFRRPRGAALLLALAASGAHAQALAPAPAPAGGESAPAEAAVPVSATAERIYADARPSLLQVRTMVDAAGRQSSIGSGFLVGADGLAITNYHVVSQYALEPRTYRLEYKRPDGSEGTLALVAVDVADDLAVVRVDGRDLPHLDFDPRAVRSGLERGERAYAIGNPLDLGFTIVEGTWNGLVERSYTDRVHFTGAINPGMSGGPAVDAAGHVVGVNVAKRLDGDLVSFLVPAAKAAALVERARAQPPLALDDARKEIGAQLVAWQAGFNGALVGKGWRTRPFGPYAAPESEAPWFTCWAQTNAEQTPRPRAQVDAETCSTEGSLFVAEDMQTGSIQFSHAYVRAVDLNAFQFAAFVGSLPMMRTAAMTNTWSRRRDTPPECRQSFVAGAAGPSPDVFATRCARAYRDFDGLYDVALTTVTQDRPREALVSKLVLEGTSYANAIEVARRYLGGIAWTK